ncbi:MAG: response regulator transcription factor [Anaerolineae bacterium]|nr:response regulator transcription factor [Anaerolineae bacterium]MCO5189505.1 response regulator transcription factor [Anaerolineae bacterium]MCO5195673.1 response regulator transcription factor [Anaerolineae bacterium]
MEPIRILIAAPDPLARSGLALMLADSDLVDVAVQMDAALSWADEAAIYAVDVVLLDVGRQMDTDLADPDTPIPVVAIVPDEAAALVAWGKGVRSVVGRSVSADSLTAALLAAAHEFAVIDPEFVAALVPDSAESDELPLEPLTPREVEVLVKLAEGMTNKAIAQALHISDHTVKFHVNAVLTKLAAQSRTEAVVNALRAGLLSL